MKNMLVPKNASNKFGTVPDHHGAIRGRNEHGKRSQASEVKEPARPDKKSQGQRDLMALAENERSGS